MAVLQTPTTILGGHTPHCSMCGVALCWDISDSDYNERPEFWDAWVCDGCDPARWHAGDIVASRKMCNSLARWQVEKVFNATVWVRYLYDDGRLGTLYKGVFKDNVMRVKSPYWEGLVKDAG